MAAPTDEEIQLLQKFRENIQDLLDGFTEFQKSDILLLGWIRARENSLPKAEAMIRKSVAWRKENDFENAVNWSPPTELSSNLPFHITGYNSSQHKNPVLIVPFGKWDLRKYVELEGGQERFIRYTQHIFGHLTKHMLAQSSFPEGKIVSQFVVVLDFQGYSFRQLASSKCVRSILDLVINFEDNCPEMLHACYIINAPKIFSLLFSLVKPMLTMRTLGKIHIYGSNPNLWKPVLLKHISSEALPPKYGGIGNNLEYAQSFLSGDDASGSTTLSVGAGKTERVSIEVPVVPSTLSWTYKVKGHDIGFRVEDNKGQVFYPHERVNEGVGQGEITLDKSGAYSLVFDNSYSRLRSKIVCYTLSIQINEGVQDPEEESLHLIKLSDSE